ncbi:MAG: DEAD/DEAH box helicase, partial [Acidobacteria bacterium]|nr:DEAD/DEAH box helicase [Acidobacteriota bacterium]
VALPEAVPASLREPVQDAIGDIALRYARTHAPFAAADFALRYGLGTAAAEAVLMRLTAQGRLIEGEFQPGGTRREWTDAGVLRRLRRLSLAKLRHEIEPVDQSVFGLFETRWQGVARRRPGADALLDAVEQLQGAPLPASILEAEILPARIDGYDPADLDAITAAGEVVWVGVESLGERDGRVALYLADDLPRLLAPIVVRREGPLDPARGGSERTRPTDRESAIIDFLHANGASFFGPLHDAVGGGYPPDTVGALWNLVWQGLVTNDTFHALRAFTRAHAPRRKTKPRRSDAVFRSRRLVPLSAEGRWVVVHAERPALRTKGGNDATKWAAAITQQLLARHGVLTREAVLSENVPGGFATTYPVLKGLEDTGRIRRGYFVAGLGALQFAQPGALDLLRSLRDAPDEAGVTVLAATDPANPYGATLRWPGRTATTVASPDAGRAPSRPFSPPTNPIGRRPPALWHARSSSARAA